MQADSIIGTLDTARCSFSEFDPLKANIAKLHIKDGAIINSDFAGMNAKSVTFECVTFGGDVNFTNTHVDDLTGLKKMLDPKKSGVLYEMILRRPLILSNSEYRGNVIF